MAETVVVRWRKFGNDRLYVRWGDGRQIGWLDLATGDEHLEEASAADAFHDAIARWTGAPKWGGHGRPQHEDAAAGSTSTTVAEGRHADGRDGDTAAGETDDRGQPSSVEEEVVGSGSESSTPSQGITTARWRKYGKDRLYVHGLGGLRLGWRDLLSGEDHLESPEHRSAFDAAVTAWLDDAGKGQAADPSTPGSCAGQEPLEPRSDGASDAAPAGAVVDMAEEESQPCAEHDSGEDPSWEDLASRRPGAAARAQAIKLRRERPVYTVVTRILRVHTDERAWRIGADGEEKVGTRLAKLAKHDPRWRVLHAVPVGHNGSDIDHLVIGPGGVFTLNSKHHPEAKLWIARDTFLVNGQHQPYIRNSRFEARRAARLLGEASGLTVPVIGVVVPVGAAEVTIKEPPVDVAVVNRMRVAKWLAARAAVLPADVVEAVFEAARRSTTWD